MRIRRLDLLRYGHFTDAEVHLPAGKLDFHIVLGLNEAGKSTALSAIEDLLFGIPHNSGRNFLHDYNSMRIGALLENGDGRLDIRRRKGNRDTILDKSGTPLPGGEAALASFLAGADRAFFTRMFCLDHERLRTGGQEILHAQDDVGQMLFSAGAGISGLRERRKALDEEADTLWASRRAGHRKYYQADDRLKTAEAALRDHTFTAAKWQDLRTALEDADAAVSSVETEIETKSAELRKLTRIRRVFRDMRKRSQLAEAIQELGEIILLPEDATSTLNEALRDESTAAIRIETLNEEIDKLEKECSELVYDKNLLIHADDIARLHERRIEIRGGRSDLPKRRAELSSAESQLARLANELDWKTVDTSGIVARIPARSKLSNVRSVLNQRGELDSMVANANSALKEIEEKTSELTRKLDEMAAAVDVSALGAVIKACREAGDIGTRIAAAHREGKDATSACDRLLKSLRPKVASLAELKAMKSPSREAIQAHRDAVRELDRRKHTCQERIRAAEQEVDRHSKAHARVAESENAVSLNEFHRLRERRQLGWSIIRRKYVDKVSVKETELRDFQSRGNLPDDYEGAVRDVDDAADRRYEKAEATARLAEISRRMSEQQELLETLHIDNDALAAEHQKLDGAWTSLWKSVGPTPLSPDEMLEWSDVRTQIVQSAERITAAERETSSLRSEEEEAKSLLGKELAAIGVDPKPVLSKPVRVLIEFAADVHKRCERQAESRTTLEDSLRSASAETERKRGVLRNAEARYTEWQEKSASVLTSLGLDPAAGSESLAIQLNIFDEMREVAAKINELQHERIDKIERDIAAYEREVGELVQAIAKPLMEMVPDDAVLELDRRSKDAKRIRELIADKEEALTLQWQKVDECRKSNLGARKTIERLQAAAAVETLEALKEAIDRSDRMRVFRGDFAALTGTLTADGDGLTVSELADECAGANPDQLAAREITASHELQSLRERLMEARQTQTDVRKNFDAVGGTDGAARAAADRQSALAEMKEIAEHYVKLRTSAILLQWAIDRYRREKQAPLLQRAGRLFAALTGQSFADLQLEFDQHDNAHLAGVRRSGGSVPVSGMSTGSADQLYLALRLAAVEDYLGHAQSLPFVADDLFINFDDERALAGFSVLGELAGKTQVLFFTHHQHLIEIAKRALGTEISIIRLSTPAVADAAAPLKAVAAS